MKASEEVLAMIALFAPYAANTNATRLLFQQIEALERVADAASALVDTLDEFGTLNGMGPSVDAVADALDALEAKR